MNPIPVTWCLGGALAAAALGAVGGWTVRDWKRDGEVLAGMKAATKAVSDQADRIGQSAQAYEQERENARTQTSARESTIREIYRDRPVPTDCAPPDSVVGVLDGAIAAANAAAAGRPAPGLPGGSGAADAAARP